MISSADSNAPLPRDPAGGGKFEYLSRHIESAHSPWSAPLIASRHDLASMVLTAFITMVEPSRMVHAIRPNVQRNDYCSAARL